MTDTYRIRTPETWDAARSAYLSGETAEDVCARFDLGLRTFRARAAEEGWRRADQDDPEPFHLMEDPSDDDLDAVTDGELRVLARRQMALAARRGRVGEALRWARLNDMVARQSEAKDRADCERAQQETREREMAESQDRLDRTRALFAANRAAHGMPDPQIVHDLHDLHSVSHAADRPAAEDAPMNRADRRRLSKERR